MKRQNIKRKKTAQDIQDEIFQKMSADRKMEIGAQLWQLAKTLSGNKIRHETGRPITSFSKNR